MFISTWLDYVGVTMGLWRYYNKLIPLMLDHISLDFALMPVTVMFFLQVKPNQRSILLLKL
ncbi:CBO0543 family protein [Priestia aryabhattai]|uniref:CBO0543 family protein n=1 Tax=Priestia aryabhattai TaxID=412384 RepID=UPI003D2B4AEA